MSGAPTQLVSQFLCTSSLILLSHSNFKKISSNALMIDRIYDKNKNKLWTDGDEQNTINLPMQKLIVILQTPISFLNIMKVSESLNSGSSILDVKPIPKAEEIPDEMPQAPKPFPDDLSELKPNTEYALPDDLSAKDKESVPKTRGIKKPVQLKRGNNNLTLLLYTNRFKYPVCTYLKK